MSIYANIYENFDEYESFADVAREITTHCSKPLCYVEEVELCDFDYFHQLEQFGLNSVSAAQVTKEDVSDKLEVLLENLDFYEEKAKEKPLFEENVSETREKINLLKEVLENAAEKPCLFWSDSTQKQHKIVAVDTVENLEHKIRGYLESYNDDFIFYDDFETFIIKEVRYLVENEMYEELHEFLGVWMKKIREEL
jgi:hypothetical protein